MSGRISSDRHLISLHQRHFILFQRALRPGAYCRLRPSAYFFNELSEPTLLQGALILEALELIWEIRCLLTLVCGNKPACKYVWHIVDPYNLWPIMLSCWPWTIEQSRTWRWWLRQISVSTVTPCLHKIKPFVQLQPRHFRSRMKADESMQTY